MDSYIKDFVTFLNSVPDVIWSGVIASFLTLSGVLISNGSNTKRLRLQLQHDSDEKAKERTAALRREVYLETVEELTKSNGNLATLPQRDPTKENLGFVFQGFFGAAAKLQLVAEPKTALLVNSLVASYSELLIKILSLSSPLQLLRGQISIYDDFYNQARAEVTRVLGELARFNETAQVDQIVFDALNRSFKQFQAQADKYGADRSEAWEKFGSLHAEFTKQLIGELRDLSHKQIPVLVEIRRDLGLTTDLDAFRLQMENQWERMSEKLDDFVDSLKAD